MIRDVSDVLRKVAYFVVWEFNGPSADLESFYAYKVYHEESVWKVECKFTKGDVAKSAIVGVDEEGNIVGYEELKEEK